MVLWSSLSSKLPVDDPESKCSCSGQWWIFVSLVIGEAGSQQWAKCCVWIVSLSFFTALFLQRVSMETDIELFVRTFQRMGCSKCFFQMSLIVEAHTVWRFANRESYLLFARMVEMCWRRRRYAVRVVILLALYWSNTMDIQGQCTHTATGIFEYLSLKWWPQVVFVFVLFLLQPWTEYFTQHCLKATKKNVCIV